MHTPLKAIGRQFQHTHDIRRRRAPAPIDPSMSGPENYARGQSHAGLRGIRRQRRRSWKRRRACSSHASRRCRRSPACSNLGQGSGTGADGQRPLPAGHRRDPPGGGAPVRSGPQRRRSNQRGTAGSTAISSAVAGAGGRLIRCIFTPQRRPGKYQPLCAALIGRRVGSGEDAAQWGRSMPCQQALLDHRGFRAILPGDGGPRHRRSTAWITGLGAACHQHSRCRQRQPLSPPPARPGRDRRLAAGAQ